MIAFISGIVIGLVIGGIVGMIYIANKIFRNYKPPSW
jgi:hypothetical protein